MVPEGNRVCDHRGRKERRKQKEEGREELPGNDMDF